MLFPLKKNMKEKHEKQEKHERKSVVICATELAGAAC